MHAHPIVRHSLVALLVAGLALAGCQSDAPPEATEPPTTPADTAPEAAPETAAAADQPTGVAWAVGQTPADAALVVAVRNVADIEKNVQAIFGPDADDLDMVEGLSEGLPEGAFDVAGPMVVIIPAPVDDPKGRDEAKPVRILGVKDASAITGKKAGAGIVAVELDGGTTAYVLKVDAWAMVCDDADPIKAIMRAEKKLTLADAQLAALHEHALWAHVNVPTLVVMAKQGIATMQQQLKEQAPQGQALPDATFDMFGWMLDVGNDVGAIQMVGDVKPDGIHLQADVRLAEGSNLVAMTEAGLDLKSYKMGLPQSDDIVFAAWAGMDWQKAIPAFKAIMKPMIDIMAKGEDEETQKAIQDMWDSYEEWGAVMGNEIGLVLELPEPGQGLYQLAEVYGVKDVAAYKELMKTYMEDSSGFMDVMMGKVGMGGGMPGMPGALPFAKPKVEYKAEAETIDGVPVDVMRIPFDVELPEGAQPEAADQIKKMVDLMYGPEGMVFRMAVVNGKGVATMGGKDVMARALKALKGDTPDLCEAPTVAAALKQVPAGQPVVLLSAANYLYFAMGFADRMMTQDIAPEILDEAEKAGHGPVAKPAVTDYVRVTGHAEGAGFAFTIDMPAADLRGLWQAAQKGGERMQFLMQKQQEMVQKTQQQNQKAQPAPTP